MDRRAGPKAEPNRLLVDAAEALVADEQQSVDNFDAGRLLQHIHLRATADGIALPNMNQISERIDREADTGARATFAPRFAALLPTGIRPLLTFVSATRSGRQAHPAALRRHGAAMRLRRTASGRRDAAGLGDALGTVDVAVCLFGVFLLPARGTNGTARGSSASRGVDSSASEVVVAGGAGRTRARAGVAVTGRGQR